jgi:hypothetical protein
VQRVRDLGVGSSCAQAPSRGPQEPPRPKNTAADMPTGLAMGLGAVAFEETRFLGLGPAVHGPIMEPRRRVRSPLGKARGLGGPPPRCKIVIAGSSFFFL